MTLVTIKTMVSSLSGSHSIIHKESDGQHIILSSKKVPRGLWKVDTTPNSHVRREIKADDNLASAIKRINKLKISSSEKKRRIDQVKKYMMKNREKGER